MPFKSDKQRAYLWANKPEVAKKLAYKQHGGPLSNYDEFDDLSWAEEGWRPSKEQQEFAGSFVPGVSSIMLGKDAYDKAAGGNYLGAAGDLGLAFLGPLAGSAVKAYKGAKGLGGALGATDELGKGPSRYSRKFDPKATDVRGRPQDVAEYLDRMGLSDTEANRNAARYILKDAEAVAKGVPETSAVKSIRVPWQGDRHKNIDYDILDYALPSKDEWKRLFPGADYPTKPQYIGFPQGKNIAVGPNRGEFKAKYKADANHPPGLRVDEAVASGRRSAPKAEVLSKVDAEKEIKKLQGLEKFGIATDADLNRLATLRGQLGLYMGGRVGPLGR